MPIRNDISPFQGSMEINPTHSVHHIQHHIFLEMHGTHPENFFCRGVAFGY
jgi:hypothetical protein